MRRRRVDSSSLRSVGYDSRSRTLEIEFHSGSAYQYLDVPQAVFEELLAQDSLGSYFNAEIRDVYACARVR
jgi:KTSC domain